MGYFLYGKEESARAGDWGIVTEEVRIKNACVIYDF